MSCWLFFQFCKEKAKLAKNIERLQAQLSDEQAKHAESEKEKAKLAKRVDKLKN